MKLLITSGCSFSQVPNSDLSWPIPLSKALNLDVECHGRGACGNGIISRTIIHAVSNALKTYRPDEILVGIMWSGLDRFEFYNKDLDLEITKMAMGNPYYTNPQNIVGPNHYNVVYPTWEDELSKMFYKNIYSDDWGAIVGIEHILRTQWYLKLNNIKYFMTGYGSDSYPQRGVENTPDVKFLFDLIDWDEWVEERNMDNWAISTGLPYREGSNHPSTEMHKKYVHEHIIPHLKKKGII